jgi:hypothetical protein
MVALCHGASQTLSFSSASCAAKIFIQLILKPSAYAETFSYSHGIPSHKDSLPPFGLVD